MITGGTNSVISVWRLRNKLTKIELLQNLYGHTEAITCLASSSAYGILVSGSRDRTVNIYDLNKLTFIRQLGSESYLEQSEEMKEKLKLALLNPQRSENSSKLLKTNSESDYQKVNFKINKDMQVQTTIFQAPISAICINDLSGDIATCCGTQIFIWTINGELLACVDIFNTIHSNMHSENRILSMLTAPTNVQILCCTFSLYKEWDEKNIFAVGCSNGSIRIYTIKYIQIPIDDNELESSLNSNLDVNNLDLSQQESVGDLIEKVNELTKKDEEESNITKTNRNKLVRADECEDEINDENCMMVMNKDEINRRMSLINVQTESQVQDDSSDEEETVKKIDPPKTQQETTIKINQEVDSNEKRSAEDRRSMKRKCPVKLNISTTSNLFEVDARKSEYHDQKLKPGFKWSRHLILENELSLIDKAAISSIAVSKDNRTLFVGDVKGRLSSFVVGNINTPQSQSPNIITKSSSDLNLSNCKQCSSQFNNQELKKVQCLNCSKYVCSK